jgi:hypothetical protein
VLQSLLQVEGVRASLFAQLAVSKTVGGTSPSTTATIKHDELGSIKNEVERARSLFRTLAHTLSRGFFETTQTVLQHERRRTKNLR